MDLKEHLIKNTQQEANVTEFAVVGTLLAATCLCLACEPLIVGMGAYLESKSKGTSHESRGSTIWDKALRARDRWLKNREKNKDTDDTDQNDDHSDNSNDSYSVSDKKLPKEVNDEASKEINKLLMIAEQQNKKEKDENLKKKNDAIISLMIAGTYDKDGNEVPVDERLNNMKDIIPEDQFESFKHDMTEQYDKIKDDEDFQAELKKVSDKIKSSEYDKFIENSKKRAKITLEQIESERKEIEEKEKEIERIKKNQPEDKDEKIKELEKEIDRLNKQSFLNSLYAKGDSEEEKKDKDSEDKDSKDKDSKEEKKDKDGNILKDEEVTDKKTGKKIKVVTHTGPRGGKFYYPKGKPKTPENKVYVKKTNESISEYLLRHIIY